ncbi:Methyltransferase domain-containing protein [Actinopolymorpha cephalotaxi]|uniref:Methyltransferase domain-containing protein n=1 Tax=Actinopolymorpha cephalotaxi TaxID=504797 RepID=A0A1I3C953_9ACTN|nr:class I SAM-dependent methyltransferase [Actinopolymorpha cephalotaxi]NYH86846.1 SAM-dependent methyltransferase [Actinopolymorpha cephalotaxi]SFH70581.1 Methyltransferase domain-containing protein [Actinopolymorpha cephalotaxi]
MQRSGGAREPVDLARWLAPAGASDAALLDPCSRPTLDVGCGPGRMAASLTARGVLALGVDTSPTAVAMTRARGAAALCRSVFDPLPGERRWGHVLLADGNIGIGGDPAALLRRVADLLEPGGNVLVETHPPGYGLQRDRVRLVDASGSAGPWFPWAWVGADAVDAICAAAGLHRRWSVSKAGRWFAELETAGSGYKRGAGARGAQR